ncbi:glycosyltransferase family 4 protein [Sphingomonas immobilis]|uniref:Glycosyltransferase family 1 protein n=1 Tax=Sphingomonas immobilis TaxID=3063997 RepID=A0ABT9A2Y7_9SPHN|nr:glycosyltransferase family 1 protein [Sphingomonas sp. CA1-15]MDO7843694.1 glycosyltransferase family 1 protein [Sphingomonas sp. CA1-15]
MKLSIDAFNLARPHGTGIATYGRILARTAKALGHDVSLLFGDKTGYSKDPLLNEIALIEAGRQDRKRLPVPVLVQRGIEALSGTLKARGGFEVPMSGQVVMPVGLPPEADRLWNVQNLYSGADIGFRAARRFTSIANYGVDLAHWTYPLPVRMPKARNVYTLHDLVPLKLPYTTADTKRVYYRMCRRIAREADHILTVSECSRRDIIEMLGVEPGRVTNLYQASDAAQTLEGVGEADIARYVEGVLGIPPKGYFLFFSAIEPKKNVAHLLEAYLGSGTQTPLVIVGAPGWGSVHDMALIKSMAALDTGKRVRWLGFLPRATLTRLIAGARAVLFPSLYEGFGLPVLEAMELGTPVITSNTSCLQEVGGDAPHYVDPYDVQSILTAIRTVDADSALRADMASKGLVQAKHFSAASYQARLAKFYGTFQ